MVCLVSSGCVSGTVTALPPPPTTLAPLTTTTIPVGQAVTLRSVPGTTRAPKVALGPGTATLSGTVIGPAVAAAPPGPAAPPATGSGARSPNPPANASGGNAPIPGATVEVERFVGSAEATTEVSAGPNGAWTLPHVLGGRYRIRAWRAPNLAQVQPDLLFVPDGQAQKVDLNVNLYSGYAVTSSLGLPFVGQPAGLAVDITSQSVDTTGVVRAVPLAGSSVTLMASAQWQVTSANPVTTDGAGQATWQLVCLAPGVQSLAVVPDGVTTLPLSVSACLGAPPPTAAPATTPPSASTTLPGGQPTTSAPGPPAT
ncbi:MAG: hypothetical protein DLM54_11005 [Acidimicrobiales bacterium]|nr:MAG: hypothetical protein DLM54_11005 [Acidimicrobiales bacterium]